MHLACNHPVIGGLQDRKKLKVAPNPMEDHSLFNLAVGRGGVQNLQHTNTTEHHQCLESVLNIWVDNPCHLGVEGTANNYIRKWYG